MLVGLINHLSNSGYYIAYLSFVWLIVVQHRYYCVFSHLRELPRQVPPHLKSTQEGSLLIVGVIGMDKIYTGDSLILVNTTSEWNITSLASAWSLIDGKILTSPITIQFMAGTYPTESMTFSHPNSNMISILVLSYQFISDRAVHNTYVQGC
jgi:hypothetical protein